MATSRNTSVEDPKAWLALAHPLRLGIMEQLQMRKAARATDLARALGVPPNSVSFHLRQLARFGYVEPDDTQRPDRREKWWRTTSPRGFRIEGRKDPEAATVLTGVMRARAVAQLEQWYDAIQLPDETFDEPLRTSNFDMHLLLTRQEREELLDELSTVFERWMERSRAAVPDDEHEEYVMFGYGLPQAGYDAVRARRAGRPAAQGRDA